MKKQIKVKTNSKKQDITEEPDGSLTVCLKSPLVDGKANDELIQLLAEKFGAPNSFKHSHQVRKVQNEAG